jgi:hypothetical protein
MRKPKVSAAMGTEASWGGEGCYTR